MRAVQIIYIYKDHIFPTSDGGKFRTTIVETHLLKYIVFRYNFLYYSKAPNHIERFTLLRAVQIIYIYKDHIFPTSDGGKFRTTIVETHLLKYIVFATTSVSE